MDLSYPTPGPPLSENIPSLTFDPSAVSPTLQQWSREISATQNEKVSTDSKTEKEAKRKSRQQTRDSVQEWLKNVQLGEIPQERSTFGSTSRYEKPSPESEDDSWEMRRGGVDRRRNIELLAKAIPDHHLSYTNLDNLALDPDFHLQTDAGTSLAHSVLQSPRTSKRDILNALVGVMKRVEDLESQLDLKTKSMKKTMKPVSGAPGEVSGSGTRLHGHRADSFLQDSKETLHRFGEHLANSNGLTRPNPPEESEESETGTRKDASCKKQENISELLQDLKAIEGVNEALNLVAPLQELTMLASRNQNSEAVPEERDVQRRRSLAEEIKSAEQLNATPELHIGGNAQVIEEDDGVLVLTEEDREEVIEEMRLSVDEHDFDVVSADGDSDGAFEVVEFDGKEMAKEKGRSSWW